ncbi:hypothetical protein AZKH_0263 [Azoarcus sp. KH32C]|nr:hypothetical protein AZKH_0263 [Azoarcus sp. KH32C]
MGMVREIELNLVKYAADVDDVWADILRVNYPRLHLTKRPSSPWKVHEVVATRARILDSGELELFADTDSGEPVTLRVPAREWGWRGR